MSGELPVRDEMVALVESVCNGTVSDDDRKHLDAALLDDPVAQQFFLEYCELHVQLYAVNGMNRTLNNVRLALAADQNVESEGVAGDKDSLPLRLVPSRPARQGLRQAIRSLARPTPFSLLTALCVVVGTIFALSWVYLEGDGQRMVMPVGGDRAKPNLVAWVNHAENCRWASGAIVRHRGDELFETDVLELAEGTIKITYKSGTTVLLQGPARFRLGADDHGTLTEGKLTAYVPTGAEGFTIDTLAAKIVDLGTKFGVSVAKTSSTLIYVFNGRVEAHQLNSVGALIRTHRLDAGQAMRFRLGQPIQQLADEQLRRFVLTLPKWRQSPDSRSIVVSTGAVKNRNGSFNIGFWFDVGDKPITINALGVYDKDGDGLAASHEVGIWDSGTVPLRSVTVPVGTAGQLDDVFRYMSVPDLTLKANTTYWIGAADFTVDPFNDSDGLSAVGYVNGPEVIRTFTTFAEGTSLVKPTVRSNGNTFGRWAGANATFLESPSVPEDVNEDDAGRRQTEGQMTEE